MTGITPQSTNNPINNTNNNNLQGNVANNENKEIKE